MLTRPRKKSFYRSANSIFGKVEQNCLRGSGTIQLITSKCLPVLLYGLEVCPLSKSDLQSLDFVVKRFLFLMKLFKPSNYDIICDCRNYLCFCLTSELLAKRHNKFLAKLNSQ